MMAASVRAITEGGKIFRVVQKYFVRSKLTCNNESIDGNTVVFVLLVGVSASQTKTGQKGSEKVEQKSDNDKSCSSTNVTCNTN